MKIKHHYIWANIKLVCTIVPTVLLMILFYFMLVRREIVTLSKEKLTLESQYYVEKVTDWTNSVLNEVSLYKDMIEQLGLEDEATYDLMSTSAGVNEAYPYGLYMGDDLGNYFDSSGWVPDDDYVVTERDWYQEGLEHDQFAFGEPYLDVLTGSTCVSASSRLKTGAAATVLSADVYLDYASQLAVEITSGKIDHAFFVTGQNRLVIADSDDAMIGTTLSPEYESLLYRNVNQLLDEGKTGQHNVFGTESIYFVDINPIPNTDWYFITCMSRNEVLKDLWRIEFPMLLIAIIASVVLFVLTSLFSKEMSSIRTKARMDPLTKLLNRASFEELVRVSLTDRPGQGLLIIMDMDNFKLINDQLGHPVGDQVLREFSTVLENYFNRNRDIVGRLGGDEFAVFVGRAITAAETEGMLRKFLSIVHQTFDEQYPDQKLSASIGVGLAINADTYEFLYQSADKALYEAKRNGKDRFQIS